MYKFVDLTKEQQHERRELLDFYGLTAQCSVILPLFAIGVLHVVSLSRKWWPRGTIETPASPYVKAAREAKGFTVAGVRNRWRRVCHTNTIRFIVPYEQTILEMAPNK